VRKTFYFYGQCNFKMKRDCVLGRCTLEANSISEVVFCDVCVSFSNYNIIQSSSIQFTVSAKVIIQDSIITGVGSLDSHS